MNTVDSPIENDNPLPLNSSFNTDTKFSRIFSFYKEQIQSKNHNPADLYNSYLSWNDFCIAASVEKEHTPFLALNEVHKCNIANNIL